MHRMSANPCGDGVIFDEQCDDANDSADDGCVACETQVGWACWGEPSTCCGPCPQGQFRLECGLTDVLGRRSGRGRCVPCPAGAYKPDVGQWDTRCFICQAGKYSQGGASECTGFEVCGPGYELSGMTTSTAGTCLACQLGKYKKSNMSSCQPQDLLLPCPAGSYRTPTPSQIASTANDGQVESVPVVFCNSIRWIIPLPLLFCPLPLSVRRALPTPSKPTLALGIPPAHRALVTMPERKARR